MASYKNMAKARAAWQEAHEREEREMKERQILLRRKVETERLIRECDSRLASAREDAAKALGREGEDLAEWVGKEVVRAAKIDPSGTL